MRKRHAHCLRAAVPRNRPVDLPLRRAYVRCRAPADPSASPPATARATSALQLPAQVIANHAVVELGDIQGKWELNIYKPLIEANVLRSIEWLSAENNAFTQRALTGLVHEATFERIVRPQNMVGRTCFFREYLCRCNAARVPADPSSAGRHVRSEDDGLNRGAGRYGRPCHGPARVAHQARVQARR